MDPACLAHRLTADELSFININGYLIVENALDAATLDRLTAAADRIDRRAD